MRSYSIRSAGRAEARTCPRAASSSSALCRLDRHCCHGRDPARFISSRLSGSMARLTSRSGRRQSTKNSRSAFGVRHAPTSTLLNYATGAMCRQPEETAVSFFVAVMGRLRNEFVLAYRDRQLCQCPANRSAEMFAQQQTERPLSCTTGLNHGRKENLRAFDRAVSARAVNLPAPGLWRRALVLHDNGKIGMIDHWLFNLADRLQC